jgi:hypothetical protein
VTVRDENGDGIPDLVVTNGDSGTLTLVPGVGLGFFNARKASTLINLGGAVVQAPTFGPDGSVGYTVTASGELVSFDLADPAAGASVAFAGPGVLAARALTTGEVVVARSDGSVDVLAAEIPGGPLQVEAQLQGQTGVPALPSALEVVQSAGGQLQVLVSSQGSDTIYVFSAPAPPTEPPASPPPSPAEPPTQEPAPTQVSSSPPTELPSGGQAAPAPPVAPPVSFPFAPPASPGLGLAGVTGFSPSLGVSGASASTSATTTILLVAAGPAGAGLAGAGGSGSSVAQGSGPSGSLALPGSTAGPLGSAALGESSGTSSGTSTSLVSLQGNSYATVAVLDFGSDSEPEGRSGPRLDLGSSYPLGDRSPLTRFVTGLEEFLNQLRAEQPQAIPAGDEGPLQDPWQEDLFHRARPLLPPMPNSAEPEEGGEEVSDLLFSAPVLLPLTWSEGRVNLRRGNGLLAPGHGTGLTGFTYEGNLPRSQP